MSRYRQTMSELLEQVRAPKESADYLMPKLNPSQINNIKKTWSMKTAKDVTPAIRDMIKKMDIPTQLAIKQAKINQLSKLVEEEYLPEFNDAMIQTLKKEYEPMRNKTISVTNANKLGALFTRFDSNKNALEKLYGADIPFISTMAMTRLMTKHGYKADKLNKIRKEELDLLEEAELLGEGTGKITGFRDNKEKSNMVSLAKQHSLKVKDIPGGIELSGNMRKILDMQLAVRSHLKTEEIDEGRMSDIDAMRKRGATAAEIAKELKLDVKAVKAILGEELTEEEDAEKLKAELKDKEQEIAQLKQKAETDKAKTAKKETEKLVNPETGEPLLQVGIAYKHLKDKMAKEKSAEADRKEEEENKKKEDVKKFKERLKESAASDKAKGMGLDYMKFGRYGKDGKVTHKAVGDTLQKVDAKGEPVKDDEPTKDEPTKDEPKADVKPKVDPFDAQKDLEDMVTDGMIDVEDDGQGGLTATKEYEPSQDYEAERDVKSIKQYFKDKGIDEKDIYVDVESEEDYIQVNVEIRGKKMEEMAKDKAYAIGMATAKKKYNDEPPLEKKTIKKGHEIADKLMGMKKEQLEEKALMLTYGKPGGDAKVYYTNFMQDLQNKAQEFRKKGFIIGKMGKSQPLNQLPKKMPMKGKEIKEGKYTRYSDLLVQLGRMKQAKDKQGEMLTQREIDKEKKKLGIKESADTRELTNLYNKRGALTPAEKKRIAELEKKLGVNEDMNKEHPAKAVYEQIKGLKNKAEKSGMPYSILKKVYDRGMAAWRGGHRPGTSQQQWAFARVNSFVTKSSGTWGGADKDLAKQVRGSK